MNCLGIGDDTVAELANMADYTLWIMEWKISEQDAKRMEMKEKSKTHDCIAS